MRDKRLLTSEELIYLNFHFDVFNLSRGTLIQNSNLQKCEESKKNFYEMPVTLDPDKMSYEKVKALINDGLDIIIKQIKRLQIRVPLYIARTVVERNKKPTIRLLALLSFFACNIYLYIRSASLPPERKHYNNNDLDNGGSLDNNATTGNVTLPPHQDTFNMYAARGFAILGCVVLTIMLFAGFLFTVLPLYKENNKETIYANGADVVRLHNLINFINHLYPEDSDKIQHIKLSDSKIPPSVFEGKLTEVMTKATQLKEIINENLESGQPSQPTETTSLFRIEVTQKFSNKELKNYAAAFIGLDPNQNQGQVLSINDKCDF